MDWFIYLIIIAVVVVVIGWICTILFWGGLAFLGFKAVKNYQREMNAIMKQFQASLSDVQTNYGGQGIPPEVQQQILNQFLQAQQQLGQFDNLSSQKHDLFVSDMLGQASSAGIDVSGWGSSMY